MAEGQQAEGVEGRLIATSNKVIREHIVAGEKAAAQRARAHSMGSERRDVHLACA
jgi:hypothetical protein